MASTKRGSDPASMVAANVRRAMRRRGYTGVQMASALGMPQSSWSRRETGKTPLTVDELIDVAEVLDEDPGALLRLYQGGMLGVTTDMRPYRYGADHLLRRLRLKVPA